MPSKAEFENILNSLKNLRVQWDISVLAFWKFYQEVKKLNPCEGIRRNFPASNRPVRIYSKEELMAEMDQIEKKPNFEHTINLFFLTIIFSFIEALADDVQKF